MKKGLLSAIALICILFVILYASAVFLPHDHHGCDSECIACAVARKWEILISGMVLCALLFGSVAGKCKQKLLLQKRTRKYAYTGFYRTF